MSVKPYKNHIVVYRDEEAHQEMYRNSSGIITTESAKKTQVSIVLDVGSVDHDILPSDRIITKAFSPTMTDVVDIGKGRYLIPRKMAMLKLVFGQDEDGTYWRSYRPFGDKVLAKRLVREFKSKAGIIIPENTEYLEQTKFSQVVEVGPECKDVKRGDMIMTEWNSAIVEVGLGSSASDYFVILPLEGIRFAFECDLQDIDADFRQPSLWESNFRKSYEKRHKK